MPFELGVLWEYKHYPAGVDSLVRCLLSLECSRHMSQEFAREEGHLVMVLDISGSMDAPGKYPLLRQALELMMANLEDGLYLTVVLFSTQAQCLCEALPAANVRSSAEAVLSAMDESPIRFQSTDLHEGLDLAIDAVRDFRTRRDDVVPRMYILTDGELTDPEICYDYTKTLEGLNIEVNSYGFGDDFALETMKEVMGRCPGAMVKHIRRTNDVRETFRRIVEVTSLIAASDVTMTLAFSGGVIPGDFFCHRPSRRIWRAHDFRPPHAPRFDLGNIEARRKYVWALEARLPEPVQPGFNLCSFRIQFRRAGKSHNASGPICVPIVPARTTGQENNAVREVFSALEGLRDNSPEVQIAAYEARIRIAQSEARDPAYIAALQNVVSKLREGVKKHEIDETEVRMADVDEETHDDLVILARSSSDSGAVDG